MLKFDPQMGCIAFGKYLWIVGINKDAANTIHLDLDSLLLSGHHPSGDYLLMQIILIRNRAFVKGPAISERFSSSEPYTF